MRKENIVYSLNIFNGISFLVKLGACRNLIAYHAQVKLLFSIYLRYS